MDTTMLPFFLILLVAMGAGIAQFINPRIFYTKVNGKNKSKGREYEVGPAVPMAQRIWGLIFAFIAFVMLIVTIQNLPKNP